MTMPRQTFSYEDLVNNRSMCPNALKRAHAMMMPYMHSLFEDDVLVNIADTVLEEQNQTLLVLRRWESTATTNVLNIVGMVRPSLEVAEVLENAGFSPYVFVDYESGYTEGTFFATSYDAKHVQPHVLTPEHTSAAQLLVHHLALDMEERAKTLRQSFFEESNFIRAAAEAYFTFSAAGDLLEL